MSTYNDKAKAYSIEYARQKLKRIPLDVQLDKYAEIQAAAASAGEPVNTYIKKAIDMRMAHKDVYVL